ncbi:MAG: hypothetical protein CVU84_15300 [Firmicutes bacterium HGW-Firmicutes-1]|jgi:hypothetical protein|nr:MAG: hypothetical protein CVU84_15300 [Firmicutes bacterium HGW-Firmicutes-1]
MNKSVVKSLILGLLILTSIYQIITLWFDNISDRNFFYSFLDKTVAIISEPKGQPDRAYMAEPHMLGVFLGASDKDFTIIQKKNLDYDKLLTASMKAFTKVLSKGKLEDVYEEDSKLWQSRGLIFALSLSMTKEALARDLNVSESSFKNLSSTKTMGLIPAKEKTDKIKAYFIDDQTGDVYVFSLGQNELREENKSIKAYINKMEDKSFPPYISSLKNDIEQFNENILLPLPTENLQYNNGLSFSTPFITDENFEKEDLEKFVNGFFDTPNVKWTIPNIDVMIYGDDDTIVKYNNGAVFEYSSVLSDNNTSLNVSECFNVAETFLAKDVLLSTQDYYLKAYTVLDKKTIFYYKYGYDGLPLLMDQQKLTNIHMKYPMEITVENGKVVKYKRVLIAINGLEGQEVFKSRLEDALNSFIGSFDVGKGELEDMCLGYVMEENKAKLMWIIKFNGKFHTLEL